MTSWFEEQIELRKRSDMEAFEDSCLKIAGSVMGKRLSSAFQNEREQATDAIGLILAYYHIKAREVPDKLSSMEEVLEYLLRPYGIMTRIVSLREGWRKDASGAMLATFADDGKPVALIPAGANRYIFSNFDKAGVFGYFGFALIATCVGMLIPWINKMLFSDIAAMKSRRR